MTLAHNGKIQTGHAQFNISESLFKPYLDHSGIWFLLEEMTIYSLNLVYKKQQHCSSIEVRHPKDCSREMLAASLCVLIMYIFSALYLLKLKSNHCRGFTSTKYITT